MKKLLLLLLLISSAGCLLAPPQGVDRSGGLLLEGEWDYTPTPIPVKDLLPTARKSLEEKKYQDTIRYCRWYIRLSPKDDLQALEARFLIAEAFYRGDHYQKAYEQYRSLVKNFAQFPNIVKARERIYEIGSAWINGRHRAFAGVFNVGAVNRGITILTRLVRQYPFMRSTSGKLIADDAVYRIANAHFDNQDYKDAVKSYHRLLVNYPRSEWADLSAFRIGLSYLRQSQGVVYDQKPLEFAKKKFNEYLQKFPRGNKVSEAKKLILSIKESQSNQLFDIAGYYRSRGYPIAALIYYKSLIRKYPDTRKAPEAKKILLQSWAQKAEKKWRSTVEYE